MNARTYIAQFEGGSLRRGFWLYVWEVSVLEAENLFYVGRTGDVSSSNAPSPFNRMGQPWELCKTKTCSDGTWKSVEST